METRSVLKRAACEACAKQKARQDKETEAILERLLLRLHEAREHTYCSNASLLIQDDD